MSWVMVPSYLEHSTFQYIIDARRHCCHQGLVMLPSRIGLLFFWAVQPLLLLNIKSHRIAAGGPDQWRSAIQSFSRRGIRNTIYFS
jgi:hypothetical protein